MQNLINPLTTKTDQELINLLQELKIQLKHTQFEPDFMALDFEFYLVNQELDSRGLLENYEINKIIQDEDTSWIDELEDLEF